MKTRQKIAALRASMKKSRIDAYYVPSTDPHQSEYLPECWKRRAWLSGFTGSAGDLQMFAVQLLRLPLSPDSLTRNHTHHRTWHEQERAGCTVGKSARSGYRSSGRSLHHRRLWSGNKDKS